MKKLIILFVVFAMLAPIIAACDGNADTDIPATPPPADAGQTQETTPAPDDTDADTDTDTDADTDQAEAAPVEIRAAWWGDTARNDLYSSIISDFEENFPHVRVVGEPLGWGDYWDRLAIQVAGGNAPDFMGQHPNFYFDYINRGALAPLDGFIADGVISLDGWSPAAINNGNVNGVQYMMTMGVSCESSFYNAGLLDSIGIDVPDFAWTWDDVRSIGVQAREAFDAAGMTDSWLIADHSANDNALMHFARSLDKTYFTTDGNFGFTVEDLTTFWEMWDELRQLGVIPDAATAVEFQGVAMEDSLFARDRIAVNILVPVNQFRLFVDTFPDKDMGIIRIPTITGGPPAEILGGATFAIAATSPPENQLAAAQLMNHWLNTPQGLEKFRLDQGVPGNLALQDAYLPYLEPSQQSIVNFFDTIIPTLPDRFMIPSPQGASEVQSLFILYAEHVAFGSMTPAAAAQAFMDEANQALEMAAE